MTGVSQEKWVSGGSGEAAAARHPSATHRGVISTEQRSYKEICQLCNICYQTARNIKRQALAKLKRCSTALPDLAFLLATSH